MKKNKRNEVVFSPTDITKFLDSIFVSWMDHYSLNCVDINSEKNIEDKVKELFDYGNKFEKEILQKFKDAQNVYDCEELNKKSIYDTINAMKSGYDVIYQGHLKKNRWEGFADFLVKVEGNSNLGNYHYTVKDTKLSRVVKSKFILQLCVYAEMLEEIQGRLPESVFIILGTGEEKEFKINEYYNFYKEKKKQFLKFHEKLGEMPIPDKNTNHGEWDLYAKKILLEKDDISLIATITKQQISNCRKSNVNNISDLININKINGINSDRLENLKKQATVQKKSSQHLIEFDVLSHSEDNPRGLYEIPDKNENDLFFNIEQSEFAYEGGLSFYFSCMSRSEFSNEMNFNKIHEKDSFEKFIDHIYEHVLNNKCNVYYYDFKNLKILKKLAYTYNTKIDKVNELLRKHVMIDLKSIVNKSVVIGFDSYNLENFFKFFDKKDLDIDVPYYLEAVFFVDKEKNELLKNEFIEKMKSLSKEKCELVFKVYEWMIGIRDKNGCRYITYQEKEESKAKEIKKLTQKEKKVDEIVIKTNPFNIEEYEKKSIEEKITEDLLPQLTQFYRNEGDIKFSSILDKFLLSEFDLIDDLDSVAFLKKIRQDENVPNVIVYSFDTNQDTKVREGDSIKVFQNKEITGKVLSFSQENGEITLSYTKKFAHLMYNKEKISIIGYSYIPCEVLEKSIKKICFDMNVSKEFLGLKKCLYDFLMKRMPDINGIKYGEELYSYENNIVDESKKIISNMNNTTIVIQGPPGTGKSFLSANVIIDLIKKGKKIGISSNSHQAINNLMLKIIELSDCKIPMVKINSIPDEDFLNIDNVLNVGSASKMDDSIHFSVVGGTAFAFSNQSMENSVDYLFIDEAGQLSLANIVAISPSAKNLVLIGDQMQLEQPIQGEHPGDVGFSCLEYYLGEVSSIPNNVGIFLRETRRMRPEICSFISNNFYSSKLLSHLSTNDRSIVSKNSKIINKSHGIQFVDVVHEGNTQSSSEEILCVSNIINELLEFDFNDRGNFRKITKKDIIVVCPYNLHVLKMKESLGDDIKIGTVDLFQGQEAPIVIYSFGASDGSGGRGLEFLLNGNRINVAVSRGMCLAIVVACSKILETKPENAEQMKMLNIFCDLIKN